MCSTLQEVEQLSNSVVHISVQLFSNQILVAKMVTEQNLLHVMIKVIQEMVGITFQPMKVNGKGLTLFQYITQYIDKIKSPYSAPL